MRSVFYISLPDNITLVGTLKVGSVLRPESDRGTFREAHETGLTPVESGDFGWWDN